ncbi:MAG: DUF1631 family protein [Gammaproteobacteria bacterium]|nr:DUF1631 family protein [Gammaproteobacteria bacterium]
MQETEPTLLLQECRQIMTKRMRSSITGMLNEVDEKLLDMAQRRSGALEEEACYEAVREIRLKRVEIKTRFERRFINLFENELKLRSQTQKNIPTGYKNILGKPQRSSSSELFKAPLEEGLGIVRQNCGQILLELDKKMSLLLDTQKSVNPMQPAFIFEAFQEACWDIKSGDEVRLMMFRIFEKRLSSELKEIYEDINTLLQKENTLEDELANQAGDIATDKAQEHEIVMLRYEVINRIENRLAGHKVPDFVRYFLIKHWRIYLEGIYVEYSENSIAWNAARQTMDDLIWMVSGPESHYDRERQVQLLPSLLYRLLNGMKVISMDEDAINAFLKNLKAHQLKSLDSTNSSLLDSITEEAIESVRSTYSKLPH